MLPGAGLRSFPTLVPARITQHYFHLILSLSLSLFLRCWVQFELTLNNQLIYSNLNTHTHTHSHGGCTVEAGHHVATIEEQEAAEAAAAIDDENAAILHDDQQPLTSSFNGHCTSFGGATNGGLGMGMGSFGSAAGAGNGVAMEPGDR